MRIFRKGLYKKTNREGILFIRHNEYDESYTICDGSPASAYNIIYEVVEIYNDKKFSKVEIINISYNKCTNRFPKRGFNPWIKDGLVHWLSPSTPFDRDNKLKDLLS